jgi:hypothetical protein
MVFLERPISAVFLALSVTLIATQLYFWLSKRKSADSQKSAAAF